MKPMLIVLDASAAVEILLQTRAAMPLTDRLLSSEALLQAPHLIDVEVSQVLRRLESRKEIAPLRAHQAMNDLADLGLDRHNHHLFLERAWQLRHNLTIYDAVYVALAEALDAPLITRDRRLERAGGHEANVEVF